MSRSASPRSLGSQTAPTRRAKRAASGVSTAATAIATRKANTASQYRMAFGEAWQGRRTGVQIESRSACAIRATSAIGSCRQLAIGDAENAYPGREHDLIALAVVLEREPVAVGLPAVELER